MKNNSPQNSSNSDDPYPDVTRLFHEVQNAKPGSDVYKSKLNELYPKLERFLRAKAARLLASRAPFASLTVTALMQEAAVALFASKNGVASLSVDSRRDLFNYIGVAMSNLVKKHDRKRATRNKHLETVYNVKQPDACAFNDVEARKKFEMARNSLFEVDKNAAAVLNVYAIADHHVATATSDGMTFNIEIRDELAKVSEIAETLDISLPTARKRLHVAKEYVKRWFDENVTEDSIYLNPNESRDAE